jgi:inner membrane transporter RhtA
MAYHRAHSAASALSGDVEHNAASSIPTVTAPAGETGPLVGDARWGLQRVPPAGLLLVGMITVQIGAALAKSLFGALGPAGVVFLRVGFASLVLLALWRPWRAVARRYARADFVAVIAFGLVLAAMNFTFYASIARIPLGVAVTVEFIGPLGVAVAGSRRLLDVLWVLLAAAGILLLAPLPTGGAATQLDPTGLALALLAGGFWAAYILLSARVGRAAPGGGGLALAMTVGAVALLPLGVLEAGSALLDPRLLLEGAAVALLSSVVPYSLELAALRRMSTRVFGVLMSLEPGLAALAGLLVLHEVISTRAVLALALVTVASICSTRFSRRPG